MSAKKERLAIIAGGGDLVTTYIDLCNKKKINFIIISIDNFFNHNSKYSVNINLSYNKIGNLFNILKKYNIKNITFLGDIKKPKLISLRPDLITIYYLLVIFFNYFKGDNNLLTKIYNIFLKKGYNIIDPKKLLKDFLASNDKNNYTLFVKKIKIKQIKKYFLLSKTFGKKDIGQAIIISNGKIILYENSNGTDDLIYRFKKLNKDKEFSILVKTSKPNQNMYLDVPTIGPKTILNMHIAKIKGIILEHNKTFIVNPKKTFRLIKKYRILFYAA